MSTNQNLIPLSKGQQAIWYLDQLENQSAHYNIAAAVTLTPKIKVSRLEQTFNLLIARHEALRTLLVLKEGQVLQSVLTSATLKITEHNAEHIDKEHIINALKKHSLQRFELHKDIPLRVEIYQQDNASIMFLCIHHMFADFWSIALIMQEFAVTYTALEKGEIPDLAPVCLSFSEYCTSSQAWLSSRAAQNARDYWLDKLTDNITPLCLSPQSPTVYNNARQGRHLKFKLSRQLTARVLQQAQDFNCTHFSVLLAYYFKLLNWISGQADIVVGIPVLGRSKAAEKLTVGYLVNGLPVYCKNIADRSIQQLSQQIHADVRQLLAKQRFPFAEIAKQYAQNRSLDSSPVFQTMFTFQRAQKGVPDYLTALTVEDDTVSYSTGHLCIRSFPFEPEIAQFELSMVMALVADQLAIDLQYDSQRINAHKAKAIGTYFEYLMDVHESVDYTLRPIPEPKYTFFGTSIVENINQRPHHTALRQNQHRLNYRELGQYCRLWMQLINTQDFKPGDAVVVRLTQGFEQISATIAIMLMGGFVAQLDRNLPEKRRQYCIDKCQAKIVIGQEKITTDGNYHSITLAEFKQHWQCFEKQDMFPINLINNDTGGALVFTSGSTGQPFCSVLSQQNLSYFTQAAIKIYQVCAEDAVLQFTSPGFDVFYEEVLPALTAGATLIPKTLDLSTDGEQFEHFLADHHISFVHLPTAFWHAWVTQMPSNENLPLPALSRINIGGEVMSPDKLKIWQSYMPDTIQLLNTYGPSEATVTSTWHEVKQTGCGAIPIGKALPGTKLIILDEKQSAVAPGQVGELYISGPGLSSGYLNDAVATAARFVTLPGIAGTWFASGDQVYQDNENILHYQGRNDAQIKFHGVRIDLNEVEQLLCQHKAVTNAVIMHHNGQLIAYIESEQALARAEWVAALSKQLLKEMIPSEFRYLSTFPKTSGGKIDRHNLREQLTSTATDTAKASVSDPELEKILQTLLNKWLAIELDAHVSFFEQGMDSLSAVAIAGNLSAHLGVKVPVRLLFEYPTLETLCATIASLKATHDAAPLISQATANQPVPLSSAQQRLLFIAQLSHGNDKNFIDIAFRLTGLIDSLKFFHDWNAVINSHDALQLSFTDMPPILQSIDPEIKHSLKYVTQSETLTYKSIETTLEQVFDSKPRQYFNSALIKIKPSQHLFLIRTHALVCDVASLEIMLNSFQQRYNSSATLPIQSSSYLQYARSISTRPSSLPYWTDYLKDCHAAPQLAIKKPQGKATLHIKSVRNSLGKEAAQQLKAFATQHQLTPAGILFSGFYAVLAKNTPDTKKFVIGTAVSHRAFEDNRHSVGPFTNFILLAGSSHYEHSFLQILKHNQQALMNAIEHQIISLEELLSLLPKANTALPVECLFLYQSAPEKSLALSGTEATLLTSHKQAMPALLSLEVTALEQDFELLMHYDTGFYDASSINSLLASIKIVLAQAINNSQLSLSQLRLLPTELQKLCQGENVEWQGKQQLLHTLFTNTARKHPLRVAIINQKLKITYGQLYRLSTRIARVIYRYRESKCPLYVGIFMDKNWQQIVAALGVLRGGGVYSPLNVNLAEAQVIDLINNTQIQVVITTSLYKKLYQWPAHVHVITLDDTAIRHASLIPLRKKKVALKPTDPAYIIFTSGTTGKPKGVVISHKSALNTIFDINQRIKLSPKDRVFGLSNFSFDLSVYDIFGTFSQGARLILPDYERLLEPSHWKALTVKHKVTVWNSVPALYRLMVDHVSSPVTSLRTVLLSGDWIPLDLPALSLSKFPAAKIISLGGATEVSIWSVAYPISAVPPEWSSIPYGLPLSNQSCYVLNEQLNICPPDVTGELYIGGIGVALEYHQNQQASDQAFVYIPSVGERLYKTGDAASLSSKGYFNILGRLDSRIKIAGQFVDLSEIEHVLESIETIAQCAVVGWNINGASQQLAAFMQIAQTLDNSSPPETQKALAIRVRQVIQDNLPRHMVPSKLVFLNTLPLTTNGKIDRPSLKHYDGEFISFQHSGKAPESPLQQTLANIWKTLLKCDEIYINDNFFELGGDSLMVVGMLSMIEQQLSVVIPIQTFLLYQSIEQLTPVISTLINKSTQPENTSSMLDSLLQGELPEVLQQEVYLDSSISNQITETKSEFPYDHVLLTGATGYLGSRLLLQILETTDAEVYCLVRSTAKHSGLDRILTQVAKIKPITAELETRIIAIEGDLAKPLLGLTQQNYHLLAKQIDQIMHCGAQVNFLLPRDNLKAINVNGCIELLRLACLHKIKPFNYISTVSVFPTITRNLQKTFYEHDSIDQPLAIVGGYPQSKWIAEKVIQLAKARGIPVNIFRPGVIFGDTRIQDLPKDVLLVDFLKVCIDLKAIPELEILIDIAPVDYIAAAIVHIFQSSSNATYHLINPQAIPFTDFIDLLIEDGMMLRKVSPQAWVKRLGEIDNTRASDGIKMLLSMFDNIQRSGAIIFGRNLQRFDCINTLQALHNTGIKCPAIDSSLIQHFHAQLLGKIS